MRETGMVIECEARKHKFLLGLQDDGYRRECPICSKPLLQPRGAYNDNEIYGMKTIGQAWREKRKANSNAKPKQSIAIAVEVDTNKLQLKLRAIAKHAEALANELDAIDNAWQCECGATGYSDVEIANKLYERTCEGCKETFVINEDDEGYDDELPTRLEGSD